MEKDERYILTMDFGTQSVRAGIFDKHGNVVAMEKEKYEPPYFSSIPGYAEQNPHYYYECLCACTKRLAEKNPDVLAQVGGITLTCFRDSAVLLDKEFKVIRPMVLWLDQRNAECAKPLPFGARFLFRLIGKSDTITFNRKRAISNWIIENEPDNWSRVYKYVNASTYFIYLLTRQLKDSSSNQAGHYPIDFQHRRWYSKPDKNLTGQIFSLKANMLCTIVPEGSLIGGLSAEAAQETGLPEGLKMYACGSDKSCETLGLGVIDDQTAAVSYGTASSIETTRSTYTESEPFLPGYPSCIPGYFNMDFQIYRGYWMINWFLKEFGGREVDNIMTSDVSVEDYNKNLKLVSPGCDGLILQPYWGPGLARPLAKGAVIGFSDVTTKEHFYRAIIEGIAYALEEGLDHFEKKIHHPIKELRVSGGGSQSEEICQITADVFGRKVTRVQTFETSSLGAAIAGFLAIKTYVRPEEAIKAMVRVKDSFEPNMKVHQKYDYLYHDVYRKIYPSLKNAYRDIKKFNKEEEIEARAHR